MRLIDAESLAENWFYTAATGTKAVELVEIEAAPTIDAVPVVRCRECKYWSELDLEGHYSDGIVCRLCIRETAWRPLFRDAKDFCSYGERKEGADHG